MHVLSSESQLISAHWSYYVSTHICFYLQCIFKHVGISSLFPSPHILISIVVI